MPALLKRLLLAHGAVDVECTPRRLAVTVADLAPRQEDVEESVRGPPAKAGRLHRMFWFSECHPPCCTILSDVLLLLLHAWQCACRHPQRLAELVRYCSPACVMGCS